MRGFTRQRSVITKGTPGCRHKWEDDRCALCQAERRMLDGFTAYWSTTDPATGERKQHTRSGFATRGAANKHLNSVVGRVDKGTWRPDRPLTVRELLELHWLPAKRAEGLRPSTASLYRRAIDTWLVPHIGGLDVRQLTPATVGQLDETLRQSGSRGGNGLSARSVQIAIGTLKSATSWAARNDLLGRDPLAGYRRPKAKSPEMDPWSEDEAAAFLRACQGDRLEWVWWLLLSTGMRRGEVCGLTWGAVELEGGTARVARTWVLVDGRPELSEPKTAAGRRSIPLDPHLVRLLRAHRAWQAEEKLRAGGAYADEGWLVADELGRPYYPDSVSGMFEKKVKALGLRRVRLHDLRHSCATSLLANGVSVVEVAALLGHDPKVTLSTYAHVVPGLGQAAVAARSARLLGTPAVAMTK